MKDQKIKFLGISLERFIKVLSIILIIYVTCFLLIFYNFNIPFIDNSANLLDKIAGTFLGACAIATITAIVMIFQDHIHSKQGKKKEIFSQKLKLYSHIITKMNSFFTPREKDGILEADSVIDKREEIELFFMKMQILLLSNHKTAISFNELTESLKDQEEGDSLIKPDSYINFAKFIEQAREDLDVQDKPTSEEDHQWQNIMLSIKNQAQDIINNVGVDSNATYFESFDKWYDIIINGQEADISSIPPKKKIRKRKLPSEAKNLCKNLYDIIKKIDKSNDVKYSPTGGCSFYFNNKKMCQINPKSNFIEILTLRDYKKDYHKPKIKNLIVKDCRNYFPHGRNNWGYHLYKIELSYNDYNNFINHIDGLLKDSYQTLIDNKILNVKKSEWPEKWNKNLKDIFDKN